MPSLGGDADLDLEASCDERTPVSTMPVQDEEGVERVVSAPPLRCCCRFHYLVKGEPYIIISSVQYFSRFCAGFFVASSANHLRQLPIISTN